MPQYDRPYDYGLRGYREIPPTGRTFPRYDWDFTRSERRTGQRSNRVTTRYNLDYVAGDRGPEYPRNFNRYGGDREIPVGDIGLYQRPYTTIGGTQTYRGSVRPLGYDPGLDLYDRDFRRRR